MSRTADYTIEGFIYQFNKTIESLLNDQSDAEITLEGISEDIEIKNDSTIQLIQCKYHESQDIFSLGKVYKPVLQMLLNYLNNPSDKVTYILFVHFNDGNIEDGHKKILTLDEVKKILRSKDKVLEHIILDIKTLINSDETKLNEFLKYFYIEFGASLDNLVTQICDLLKKVEGINEGLIRTLYYPNLLNFIADKSIEHEITNRKIKKSHCIDKLMDVRSVSISKWTLALKNRKDLLILRKKQLGENLNKSSRLRYFILSDEILNNFSDSVISLIDDYIYKYHSKTRNDKTPIFCLECSLETLNDIKKRLHLKGIKYWDGIVVDCFDKKHFLKEPMIQILQNKSLREVEFSIKLCHLNHDSIEFINENKCQDLFLISNKKYEEIDTLDLNVELIECSNIQEIKYILTIAQTYE